MPWPSRPGAAGTSETDRPAGQLGCRVDPTGKLLSAPPSRCAARSNTACARCRLVPRERFDAEQHRLKIIANATCYGIFVELNVIEYARKREVTYYGFDSEPHRQVASIESGLLRLLPR